MNCSYPATNNTGAHFKTSKTHRSAVTLSAIALFVALAWPFAVQGQGDAQIALDSSSVETGNAITLHLSLHANRRPDTINYAPWQDFFDPKNLLEESEWQRFDADALQKDITVLFFDADTLHFPALAITFDGKDTLFTNPFDLTVYATPAPDDLNDMAPIKDIHRELVQWTDYLPVVGIVLAGLAILALVFWWISRKRIVSAQSRVVEMPPHELALKKLNQLQQRGLWQQGAIKEYCAELTFILREYLEKRFGLPALESSSEDLLRNLDASDFPAAYKNDFAGLLYHADLAKFAKGLPPEDFYERSMTFADQLIRQTTPVEPEPDPSAHS